MTDLARGKRSDRCDGCRLPVRRCLCGAAPRLHTRTRVVVVMHRNEWLKSSNTARLAARVLDRVEVRLRGVRDAGSDEVAPLPPGRRVVLFPGSSATPLVRPAGSGEVVLLVPDGSWSQARKLVQRDPLLRDAEAVRLPDPPPSVYRLRRNVRPGTLCTFEAIARALSILEDDGEALERRLLSVLETFQERSLEFRVAPERHSGGPA